MVIWLVRICSFALVGAALASDRPAGGVVRVVEKEVAPVIKKLLAKQRQAVKLELNLANRWPGIAKTAVRMKGVNDPWGAMAELENHGRKVVQAAQRGRRDLGPVINAMAAAMGKPAGQATIPPLPVDPGLAALADWIEKVFTAARKERDAALAKLSEKERAFLAAHGKNFLVNYGPQLPFNSQTKGILARDAAFVSLVDERLDWARLLNSAHIISIFAKPQFAKLARAACRKDSRLSASIEGVKGKLLYQRETACGLILIGSTGKNTYLVKQPVALIIDPGGNDTYGGHVAASTDLEHPFGVIVDLGGKDHYTGEKMRLAFGCCGVGLLCDHGGDDQYNLGEATGGVGLGGIGILFDAAGNDTYKGSKFTQGTAIAGLGLLLDMTGNDQYTAFGYGVGFGGSGGVGALVDIKGKDSYQCGGKYPSGYNQLDKSKPKPGDARFQWTAFGMGMGLGRRIIGSSNIQDHRHALAGGIGMVLDAAGDDHYQSANFSQGCGYYFGAGLKLDLDGDDQHHAARYGHASGAHFGMGLFIDGQGKDYYHSTGPTYNCGCAWDRSIFMCVDSGRGNDTYDLLRSAGLGRADIGSWGIFADLAGRDVYKLNQRPGIANKTGIGVFFDRKGVDVYPPWNKKKKPAKPVKDQVKKGQPRPTKGGGLFWDRNQR